MLRKMYKVVDKMPLAGKYATSHALKGYTKSELGNEKLKFASTSALLGLFVVGHALQVKSGVATFSRHLEQLESGDADVRNALFMGFDVLYATANAAVTTRHASLMRTTNHIRQRRSARIEKRQGRLAEQPALASVRSEETLPQAPAHGDDTSTLTPKPRVDLKESLRRNLLPIKKELGAIATISAFTFGAQGAAIASWADSLVQERLAVCRDEVGKVTTQASEVPKILEASNPAWVDYYCEADPGDVLHFLPDVLESQAFPDAQ